MPAANLVKNFNETITRLNRSKKWPPAVTTERTEMEIAAAVTSPERVPHRRKTRTLKSEGCGTQVSYQQEVLPKWHNSAVFHQQPNESPPVSALHDDSIMRASRQCRSNGNYVVEASAVDVVPRGEVGFDSGCRTLRFQGCGL
jgi:hypothetical protein